VLNGSAFDDLEFLCFGHSCSHVNKDCLFMKERVQGIYFALRHPLPFLFGEIYQFMFRVAVAALLLDRIACAALTQDGDRRQGDQSERHNWNDRASQYFGPNRRFHSVLFHGDILHHNLLSYFFMGASTPENTRTASGRRCPLTSIALTAEFSSETSACVKRTLAAPLFSTMCCITVVPGIGTIQGFCAISQATAI